MKYLLMMIVILSCSRTPIETQKEIDYMEVTHRNLKHDIVVATRQYRTILKKYNKKINTIAILDKRLAIKGQPLYVLTIKSKKSSFSLSIARHVKDNMNSVKFNIAVDKQLYDRVNVGDNLSDAFTKGSLLFGGSLGSIKITVVRKQIKART